MITQDELMTRIVPSIGVVIGTLMFLSPLKAVLDMRRTGRIGVGLMSTKLMPVRDLKQLSPSCTSPDRSNRCQHLLFG